MMVFRGTKFNFKIRVAFATGIVVATVNLYRLSDVTQNLVFRTDTASDLVNGRCGSFEKLPDALIVGFEKCGTITLRRFLGVHPEIVTPGPNDGFFGNLTKTLEDYERSVQCTPPDRLRVDKMDVGGSPEKVYKHKKDMKLLVIVRDPVERCISHYAHRMAKQDNLSSFDEITDAYLENPYNPYSFIIRFSLYLVKLEPWLQLFPRSQFHVVDGDEFSRNPAGELRKVERFLGVRPFITEDHFVYNEEKKFYCLKEIGCMADDKGRSHPSVSPETIQKLKDYFVPYNEDFFKVFGSFSWH